MPTTRAIRPTDLLPLLAFLRNGSLQEITAQLWPELRADAGTRVMREMLRRMMTHPAGYTQAWVCVDNALIKGLVVVRPRAGKLAWDIKDLLVTEDQGPAGAALLEHVSSEAARRGARRLFLSVCTDADATRVARQGGFAHFTSETLYGIKMPTAVGTNGLRPARPRLRQDTHALFQLYNNAVPFKVRVSEAATMEEWISLDRSNRPWAPRLGGTVQHYVWDEQGELGGWLQVSFGAKSQLLVLLVSPSHSASTDEMLQYALSQVSHKVPIYAPVRDYQPELASALERAGFSMAAEYHIFAREMTARVPNRVFVPARA